MEDIRGSCRLRRLVRHGPRSLACSRRPVCPAQRLYGKSDVLDKAIAACAVAYADQNEHDRASLGRAIRKGKVKAVLEELR